MSDVRAVIRKWCPNCDRAYETGRESCPTCLATLEAAPDTTLVCPVCGASNASNRTTCKSCFAMLHAEAIAEGKASFIGMGHRLLRPMSQPAFVDGGRVEVVRLSMGPSLAVCGVGGAIEAWVTGDTWTKTVTVTDVTEQLLFHMEPYEPVKGAVVAFGADGASIGTFLRNGPLNDPRLDVRDETSAPVARLMRGTAEWDWDLMETGGGRLGGMFVRPASLGQMVDDAWRFLPLVEHLPLSTLNQVAMVVAAKLLLGQPQPVAKPQDREHPLPHAVFAATDTEIWSRLSNE